jgi:hypothetical protein
LITKTITQVIGYFAALKHVQLRYSTDVHAEYHRLFPPQGCGISAAKMGEAGRVRHRMDSG